MLVRIAIVLIAAALLLPELAHGACLPGTDPCLDVGRIFWDPWGDDPRWEPVRFLGWIAR